MPGFIIRVELHGATKADYDALHAAMTASGFGSTVTGSDGIRYRLPTAEYFTDAQSTAEMARLQAANAAGSTGKAFAVLVTPIAGLLYWQNLQKA